jgi:twitching motility two-component system response regulator PilH
VLLIDNHPNTRAAIARLVRQEGVVVAEAPDRQDGFQRASETLPDLIITDISMPIMNGWELIRRLRADDRTRHIPVIVCSGRDRPSGPVEFEPDAYLRKTRRSVCSHALPPTMECDPDREDGEGGLRLSACRPRRLGQITIAVSAQSLFAVIENR